jgi:rSAM/selenodomain-associated transferase 1
VTFEINATVVVLAKSPRAGRVKTRLCPPCTPEEAAAVATAALADTLDTVDALPVRRRVLALDGPIGPWLPAGCAVVPQVTGDLGARLEAAFTAVDGPAFVVGMDTPQLSVELLVDALHALANADAVLGLAADGGWWGLGLARPTAGVFDGVPMSSSRTGAMQRERLRRLGLRTQLLPELRDVDHFADARAVAAMRPGSRFASAVSIVSARAEARAVEPVL